jgi:murein DD-endopeptidase MepM/ murein hydrolase activator NlpD
MPTAHRRDWSRALVTLLCILHASPARPVETESAATTAPYAFAPVGATPDPLVRYALPFALDRPWMLTQGIGGGFSHTGEMQYAFDWAMPEGTEVLAAREGVVARVQDGFSESGIDPKFARKENHVLVLHADGTFGAYLHLRKGIPLVEGQQIRTRERIGWSGNTGQSSAPHLHFSVHRRAGATLTESVPIRFGVGNPVGFVPEFGKFYGNRPRTNAELRIRGPGPVDDATPLRPMAWATSVTASGLVRASPTPDFAQALARLPAEMKPGAGAHESGVVVIHYEDPTANLRGFASVAVLIEPPPR